jgi:transcriptional regulator with XRE-family HTH domain
MLNSISRSTNGEELRQRRVFVRLTQADVARAAGMTQSQLSNYENDVHAPSEASRERVLKAIEGLRLPAVWNTIIFGKKRH